MELSTPMEDTSVKEVIIIDSWLATLEKKSLISEEDVCCSPPFLMHILADSLDLAKHNNLHLQMQTVRTLEKKPSPFLSFAFAMGR